MLMSHLWLVCGWSGLLFRLIRVTTLLWTETYSRLSFKLVSVNRTPCTVFFQTLEIFSGTYLLFFIKTSTRCGPQLFNTVLNKHSFHKNPKEETIFKIFIQFSYTYQGHYERLYKNICIYKVFIFQSPLLLFWNFENLILYTNSLMFLLWFVFYFPRN